MALITQVSDPVLWAKLYDEWMSEENREPGWVYLDGASYQVMYETSGDVGFVKHENIDMIDSRSIIGSKPTTYSLDGE